MVTVHQTVSKSTISSRAEDLYHQAQRENHQGNIRVIAVLMAIQWLVTIVAALGLLPSVWPSEQGQLQLHVAATMLLASFFTAVPVYLAVRHPGRVETGHIIAVAQACISCLLIHISGGRIETHFHIVASLVFLAGLRDWRVIMSASLVVVVDHFIRTLLWPQSVFGLAEAGLWRWAEHCLWIAFVDVFLIVGCLRGRRELIQVAWRTAELETQLEESREQTRQLKCEQSARESLMEQVPDAVVTMDETGTITGWNKQAQSLFGWSAQEATGGSCENLFLPRNSTSKHHNCFAWTTHHRKPRLCERIETSFWNRNRDQIPVEVTFTKSSLGGKPHYNAFIRDISEQKVQQEELESARIAAEANCQAKTQFLSNMSHELRTPLTAILGFTHVLRFESDEPSEMSQDEILDAIEASGKNLLELLNDLFDLTRIESGQIAIIRDHCDPNVIITEAFESYRHSAGDKGLSLEMRWSSQRPASIRTDPLRLSQILNNLLSNAVKFTENGSIEMEARIERLAGQPAQLVVAVRDTGIGISKDSLERIFLPFEQVDGSLTRRQGGTGLGLAVSRRLAHELNGSLTVESRIGYGTVFTLTVEVGNALFGQVDSSTETSDGNDPPDNNWMPAESISDKPDLTGLRVLLCEDKLENRKLLEFLITSSGGEVAVAVNGHEGIALALEQSFDIIVMDMQMPVVDGYSATRRLRSEGVDIPIVALTAHTMNRAKERSLEAGCTHFVSKPFNPRELLGRLREFAFQSAELATS